MQKNDNEYHSIDIYCHFYFIDIHLLCEFSKTEKLYTLFRINNMTRMAPTKTIGATLTNSHSNT